MACDPVALAKKINEAENALGRALTAAQKKNIAKAITDTQTGIALAQEALAMCHEPAPPPPPPPPPAPTPTPSFTTRPTISPTGHVHVGDRLTAHPGECPGALSYDVRWYLEGQPAEAVASDPLAYDPSAPGGVYVWVIAALPGGATAEAWSDILTISAAHDPAPAPTPTPPPPPPPSPPPPPPALPGEPSGLYPAHEFTEAEWEQFTRPSGVPPLVGQTATGFGEDTSAWRLKLRPSGFLSYDDPIIFPGEPGRAHLHHAWTVPFDAFSTHESLMNGSVNRLVHGGPLYHSAIWAPAMMNMLVGEVPNLHGGDLYYKVHPPGHPSLYGDEVQNVPKGLKLVPKGARFTLGEYDAAGVNVVKFHTKDHPTLAEMIAEWDRNNGGPTPIPVNFCVRMGLANPQCWNGTDLWLPGNAHMAERIRDASTNWQNRAPSTHPIVIPTPHPIAFYRVLAVDEVRHWRLSSDVDGELAGHSAHWDYIEAINDRVRAGMWEIFVEHRNTSGGTIGLTGRSLVGPLGDGSPARLAIPLRPAPMLHH